MKTLTQEFYNEYTRLDDLCRTIYESDKGVSTYIEMMSTVFPRYSAKIPLWHEDLRHLMQLRHIRNTIAHTVDGFDMDLCAEENVRWLKEFYRRILDRSDPLAQLRLYFQKIKQDSMNP